MSYVKMSYVICHDVMRLHNMSFRHLDHRVDRIKTEDVNFNFGSHALTHGTTLRRLPINNARIEEFIHDGGSR